MIAFDSVVVIVAVVVVVVVVAAAVVVVVVVTALSALLCMIKNKLASCHSCHASTKRRVRSVTHEQSRPL